MSRWAKALALGVESGLLGMWFVGLTVEGGVDQLLYHRIAEAIVRFGRAPWIVHPLAYLGMYPASDSPGVPFLVASFASLSGLPLGYAVLFYDALLLVILSGGLFMLTHLFTRRIDVALLAILLAGLSYGFSTSISWSLDERSFNVAFAPVFLYLLIPRPWARPFENGSRKVPLALIAFTMLVSHLSVLLLLPLIVLVPMVYVVVARQHAARRGRWSSLLFIGVIAAFPLVLLSAASLLGLLTSIGLENQLERSAIFSGSSPVVFFLNAMVFLATRTGPVIPILAGFSIAYFAARRSLWSPQILIGSLLLGGFVGLPAILYSKDLLTPILVIPASMVGTTLAVPKIKKRVVVLSLTSLVALAGSVSFNHWNLTRTNAIAESLFWNAPRVDSEALSVNTWLLQEASNGECIYGNNWLAVRRVATQSYLFICGDTPLDYLVKSEVVPPRSQELVTFRFAGLVSVLPTEWFNSPELTRVAQDFAKIPQMDFLGARSMLLRYGVGHIVVSLERPTAVPAYHFQGTYESRFFEQLWQYRYPIYMTERFAVFEL